MEVTPGPGSQQSEGNVLLIQTQHRIVFSSQDILYHLSGSQPSLLTKIPQDIIQAMYNVQCIIYIRIKANTLTFRYSTPLHDAVACGRQEIAKILVERGANVRK